MSKITTILNSNDEGNVSHMILPDGVTIKELYLQWEDWYKTSYTSELKHPEIKFISFSEWCYKNGARKLTEDEMEIFDENELFNLWW